MRSGLLLMLVFSILFGPALCCCTAREAQAADCGTDRMPDKNDEQKPAPGLPKCCHNQAAPEREKPTDSAPLKQQPTCLCHVEQPTATVADKSVSVDPPTLVDRLMLVDEVLPVRQHGVFSRFIWPGGDPATFLHDFCHILRC